MVIRSTPDRNVQVRALAGQGRCTRLHRSKRELISVRYCLELLCYEMRSVVLMYMYSYKGCRHSFAHALALLVMYSV